MSREKAAAPGPAVRTAEEIADGLLAGRGAEIDRLLGLRSAAAADRDRALRERAAATARTRRALEGLLNEQRELINQLERVESQIRGATDLTQQEEAALDRQALVLERALRECPVPAVAALSEAFDELTAMLWGPGLPSHWGRPARDAWHLELRTLGSAINAIALLPDPPAPNVEALQAAVEALDVHRWGAQRPSLTSNRILPEDPPVTEDRDLPGVET